MKLQKENFFYSEINLFLKKIIKILKKEKKFKKIFLKYQPPLVFLVDSNLMISLEKKFFKKNKEPDILSFNWPPNFKQGKNKKNPLGEIYLNKRVLKNKNKIKYLLIHGILHLLGFNHYKKNDIIKMENKEQEILNQL
ncbi:MAG: rRNA maturation RNase YbeY [Patescibacteria group bacterium]|nr:rRNA maturation RNase YbeY [Patescibacteria group bacterium]MCX7589940.1 rRNA maturation RNase YbeY [Patescibacteria group bacterium]MDW8279782.1 rRNA maturation RNase YbeY [bacterium]